MTTIHITLIRFNGRLIGASAQDRWNLQMLGINSIECDRNQAALKRVRRMYIIPGGDTQFTFTVKRGTCKEDMDQSWQWGASADCMTRLGMYSFEYEWNDSFNEGTYLFRAVA